MGKAGGLVGLSPKFLNLMYYILFTFLFRNNFLNLCLISDVSINLNSAAIAGITSAQGQRRKLMMM